VHVVAGVLRDAGGRILLTQRPPGKHLAGLWEFPGGKCEADEAPLEALRRELREELGVEVGAAEKLIAVPWRYAEKSICLDVYTIRDHVGEPHGREGQLLQWVDAHAIGDVDMPPADRPVVSALQLPRRYAISSEPADTPTFLQALVRAIDSGETLLQLRSKQRAGDALRVLLPQAAALAATRGARVLLNGNAELAAEFGLAGVHLPSVELMRCRSRPLPAQRLVAASCHDARELAHAAAIGVDFAVLGPVAATSSHRGQPALGWQAFAKLCADAPFPVYALGGMQRSDLARAIDAGAQGIAGISAFWPAALG